MFEEMIGQTINLAKGKMGLDYVIKSAQKICEFILNENGPEEDGHKIRNFLNLMVDNYQGKSKKTFSKEPIVLSNVIDRLHNPKTIDALLNLSAVRLPNKKTLREIIKNEFKQFPMHLLERENYQSRTWYPIGLDNIKDPTILSGKARRNWNLEKPRRCK